MEDRLLDYYERELTFIREMGLEFAKKYPKIAGRLLLEGDKCEDPHTERLIEAFALISGRIHKKIDDDFPEITESLLNIIYPHYTNPFPSMSVVRFEPVIQNILESGYGIEKGTALFSKPLRGTPCRFSTTQAVHIWPVRVAAAGLKEPKTFVQGAVQVLELEIQSLNKINLNKIEWQSLRFFLNGPHQHVFHLYELIFNHVSRLECEVTLSDGSSKIVAMGPDLIRPVGFSEAHGMLPYSKRSFPGYLLLFEYFCFPEKFLFFDLNGLDRLRTQETADVMTFRIYLNRAGKEDLVVNADTFCLNASPVVNLFRRLAEPIRVEHRKTEYQVVPDMRRKDAMEVYSVDQVTASLSGASGVQSEYKPFYSMRHHLEDDGSVGAQTFWHMQRRASTRKDDRGTDVFLSFSDLSLKPKDPAEAILTVRVTCTNRDLPSRLPFGDADGDFNMESAAPVARIICMLKPTPTRRPFLGGALQWRLISHLSLNYMSLVQGGEQALKEILKLYDFDNTLSSQQTINGIVAVDSRHVTKRIKRSFCRGVRVTITFDEDKYVGTGLFLFASVLERFLSQYVSVNSFSQLEIRTLQREEPVKIWPPRSGNQILL
ncbi:type VI secretion system baseplate subunit TssF [Desulfosarcina sp.]|uniref:type VI secretion system baseplate subunit TssF n=1 Tax=Desulfosarcina sp. TaxID=2027861 RepID=UPI003970D8A7